MAFVSIAFPAGPAAAKDVHTPSAGDVDNSSEPPAGAGGDGPSVERVDDRTFGAGSGLRVGTSGGSGSGSGGSSGCVWELVGVSGVDREFSALAVDSRGEGLSRLVGGVESRLYRVDCPGAGPVFRWVRDVSARDLLVEVSEYVEGRLHHPEPVILPFDEEEDWTYVRVPLDFRTSEGSVEPIVVSASAGPPGGPWVEVTAKPVGFHFLPNDPTDIDDIASCGIDFATAPYVGSRPGLCSYTYVNASSITDSGVFDAQLGFTWDVSYQSSIGEALLICRRRLPIIRSGLLRSRHW